MSATEVEVRICRDPDCCKLVPEDADVRARYCSDDCRRRVANERAARLARKRRRARSPGVRVCAARDCGELIPPDAHGAQAYCADACRQRENHRAYSERHPLPETPPMPCAWSGCGQLVEDARRMYCSKSCANAAHLARKAEARLKAGIEPRQLKPVEPEPEPQPEPPRTWGGPPFEVVRERLVAARRRGEDFRDAWPSATHADGKSDTLNAVALAETWESWANAYERIPATQAEAAAARLLGG